MNPITQIDEIVDVVPIFRGRGSDANRCIPHKMIYHNQEITFSKLGMRHATSQGKRMIHVFDMTDGSNDYRLELDAERLVWRLVSMIEGRYV